MCHFEKSLPPSTKQLCDILIILNLPRDETTLYKSIMPSLCQINTIRMISLHILILFKFVTATKTIFGQNLTRKCAFHFTQKLMSQTFFGRMTT